MPETEFNQLPVFFKELRQIHIFSSFIGLLVKIYGAYPVLEIFNIRGDVDYEIVCTHIAKQAYETTLVEFDEFLGKPDAVGILLLQISTDKNIAGYARNMFFGKGMLMGEKTDPVGRKQV